MTERLELAHALRTPLTSALLAAGTLDALGPLNDAQAEALRTLVEDLRRLKVLCERELDTTRAGAHAGPLERHAVQAREVLGRAIEPLRAQAAERNVRLTVTGRSAATLLVDPVKVAWALSTLVGNALRYARRSVSVRILARERCVAIAIADDGPGIAPTVLSRLFEREGSGLGLYLVHEIIEAHGGSIEVASQPGASFLVTLPRLENDR